MRTAAAYLCTMLGPSEVHSAICERSIHGRPPTRSGRVPAREHEPALPSAQPSQRAGDRDRGRAREIYLDRESGDPLEVVGKVLPLAPSPSRLPWAVENLRFCPWCGELAQKDLNDCPTCGRRMGPLSRVRQARAAAPRLSA